MTRPFALRFPDLVPATLVTRELPRLRAFGKLTEVNGPAPPAWSRSTG